MKLQITAQHIERAYQALAANERRRSCCPVAQALLDTGAAWVVVRCRDAETADERRYHLYTLADDARDFVQRFDDGGPVQPCTVTLHPAGGAA